MQDEEFKVPNEKRLEVQIKRFLLQKTIAIQEKNVLQTAFRAIEAQFGQLTKEQLETCLSNDGERFC